MFSRSVLIAYKNIKERDNMKSKLMLSTLAFALLGMFFVAPSAAPALAQNTTGTTQTGGASSSQTTTTTTKSTEPASQSGQTTTTVKNTGIDPLWLVLGGVGLLALLAIVALSMRGRSRDTTVVERDTVIRK